MVAAMVVIATVIASRRQLHRFEFERGHPGGDIQSGLPLHADWLQRVGIRGTAEQEVAAEAQPDRRIGADATKIASEFAAPDLRDRRIDCPSQPGLACNAEIQSEASDGCDIGFGTVPFALEHAL